MKWPKKIWFEFLQAGAEIWARFAQPYRRERARTEMLESMRLEELWRSKDCVETASSFHDRAERFRAMWLELGGREQLVRSAQREIGRLRRML